jgi:hypothetical protein
MEPKPWNVAQFETYRSHMTDWVCSNIVPLLDDKDYRRVVVRAPVKSGKREMVEYIAKRDESHNSPRAHAFISAWHRTADDDQRKELALHNMKVFSITKKTASDDCINWIDTQIQKGKNVVIHIDECDHGSGEKQILGKVYNKFHENSEVFTILYSATPQEVLFSTDVESENNMLDDMMYGTHVEYVPPESYCGPKRFLDENLVFDAKPFFKLLPAPALTDQGRELIEGLKTSTKKGRNVLVLRLTKSDGRGKTNKEIYKFLQNSNKIPELKGVHIWVDKNECAWGNSHKILWSSRDYWITTAMNVPILIVIDQTSSRSTEWACHDRIFATHDYRTSLQYAILSQAQERVNHYEGKYGGFQPIHVYGHKKTFELSANMITYEKYFECEWTMRKVDTRRSTRDNLGEVYEIKNSNGLHPNHQLPISKERAEEVLREIGCFGDVSLSSRVIGNLRSLPVFNTEWFPCEEYTWDTVIDRVKNIIANGKFRQHSFNNPFLNARKCGHSPGSDGKAIGYLRGWHVLDYETQVKLQPGWGVELDKPRITVCYNGGVGAAIRWHTGEFRESNRLNTYRSMYPSKK